MSRIFVTGDTHASFERLSFKNWPEGKNLTRDDYVIITGDCGLLFDYKETGSSIPANPNDKCWSKEEIYWYKWLCNKPFTILFIDGNHENFDRLNYYPVQEWHGGNVHKLSNNIIHLMRGEIYTIAGKTFFTFGGAKSTDRGKATGTEEKDIHKIWWPQELPSLDERDRALQSLILFNYNVDYVITHALPNNLHMRLGYADFDILTSFLWNIKDTVTFKEWYCGHYHKDEQIDFKTRILYNDIVEI